MPKKQDNIVNSLAHTKWNCKYHIVFAPKYRRKIFYEEKKIGDNGYIKNNMRMERSRNNRWRSMSRSCTSVVKYPAQNERFVFRRILKRKK